jgi:altronate dehydratase small subunit
MEKKPLVYTAIKISGRDNVATLVKDSRAGETVLYLDGEESKTVVSRGVPQYHKIALCPIPKDSSIIKYGEVIAAASRDIAEGEHVHCHNMTNGVSK